jgi:FkbM family methyltransferase
MSVLESAKNLLSYSISHPVGKRQPLRTMVRIVSWQMRSRLSTTPLRRRWLGDTVLVVEHGMTGVTGNLYFGLHEFADMAFVLHFLREDDLFFDIGANVGSYSVLAGKLSGAEVRSFEPDPVAASRLSRNIEANGLADRVAIENVALGEVDGTIGFTSGKDATNHVTDDPALIGQTVAVRRLDDIVGDRIPALMKIDVEGHEESVFRGADRVLKEPDLRAIEVETVSPASAQRLLASGFTRVWYDPINRRLLTQPAGFECNNQLFVRDVKEVEKRVSSSRPIDIYGWKV